MKSLILLPAIFLVGCVDGTPARPEIKIQPNGSTHIRVGEVLRVYFQAPEKHVALLESQRQVVRKRDGSDKDSSYPYYCTIRAINEGTYTFTVTSEDVAESLIIWVTK